MAKCLDMGVINYPGDPEDLQYVAPDGQSNIQQVLQTGTPWIRVWILWDLAEPAPGVYNTDYLAAIDRQVAIARFWGKGVVLVSFQFPRWANGTQGVDDISFQLQDRQRSDGSGRKPLEWRIPEAELSVTGHWGRWVNFLINRYRQTGWWLVLEVMNEPNFQMWPQQNGGGQITIHHRVAEMMLTAALVNQLNGYPVIVAAPATSDHRRGPSRYETPYDLFLANLVNALDNRNYRGEPSYVWTQHNYRDIETNSGEGAASVRRVLTNWWRGWSGTRGDGSDPAIWMTEGGARPEVVGGLDKQAAYVASAWTRLAAAPGVWLFTNYLLHSHPSFDTGLRDPLPGGGPRPLWSTFVNFPPQAHE